MTIVIIIPSSSKSVAAGPDGGVKASGGGVANASGGGVGMTKPGGGDPKTKPGGGDPKPKKKVEPAPGQVEESSWNRCPALGTNGRRTSKAQPPNTPTSNPASAGSGPELTARPVANPAAADITTKMKSAPRLNSGMISGPARQSAPGDIQVTARLAASVQLNAMIPAISP